MKIYVFGNQDESSDDYAIKISQKLKNDFPQLEFLYIKPNEDIPFIDTEKKYLLDVIKGLQTVQLFTENDINKIELSNRGTTHDFDLGFQLKYLTKLGKLNKFLIIGVPQKQRSDYSRLKSIFKKLVAQDIQGS